MIRKPVEYSEPDSLTNEVWQWNEYVDEENDSMESMAYEIRSIHGNVEIAWFKGYARVSLRIKKDEMKSTKIVKPTIKKPILQK